MNHPLKRMMFSSVELFCLVAEYESFSAGLWNRCGAFVRRAIEAAGRGEYYLYAEGFEYDDGIFFGKASHVVCFAQ